MIKSIKKFTALALITMVIGATSCVKKDSFDDTAPSTNVDPGLTANITTDSLKSLATGNAPQYIYDDLIWKGIVIADDRSGNFYKEIVLQDETGNGGISILLDQSNYYTYYPIGRRVFVKLKGLFIGSVDGNIKIGALVNSALDRIPATLVSDHLIGGKWNLQVTAKNVKISEITMDDINTLIEIDSVQFESASIGKPFADAVHQNTINHNIEECSGGFIIIRTSGFANFATTSVPCRAGKLRGVYQIYDYGSGFDPQIYLRDINDVIMDDERCGTVTTPTDTLMEYFTNISTSGTLKDTGWAVVTVTGDNSWQGDLTSGEYSAEATAYSAAGAVETWLITPPLDLSIADTLSFETQTAFHVVGHNGLTIWFTNSFDACNPSASVWQPLTATFANSGTSSAWIPSGDVPLSSFSGTGFIGFKYVGNGTGQTMNYRVDDVKVR